ncbi:hypothetical protein Q7C18_02625 [Nesterenkonia sp. CL21]|uniref:hypothetical protein n=1 Tax=Nesterenkonia sp. CL21 TaxID=3064894 RepID=UPI00287AB51E|nr:hypothetical protein [Nesterenkonia sp. CL21]MDS2171583.1 hypothetical protein [Nesterenkonia sp. CL21]
MNIEIKAWWSIEQDRRGWWAKLTTKPKGGGEVLDADYFETLLGAVGHIARMEAEQGEGA